MTIRRCSRVEPEWPEDVVQVDHAVAQLATRHMAAIMANYFSMELPAERRAQIYIGLARNLAKTRPAPAQRPRPTTIGRNAFREDLGVARWLLKSALRL